MTFKLSVFHLWQTNFASDEELTGSLVWGLFIFATSVLCMKRIILAVNVRVQILPIHCSMVGCRRLLHHYIHANVYLIFLVLCAFGAAGYLRYGTNVPQILVLAITQHTPLSLLVDATLVVSVLFTFPLQCFPVIEILEGYILTPGL